MNATKPIYQLGDATFSITHDDPDFEQVISRLLPLAIDQSANTEQVLDLQMGLSLDISQCFSKIIGQHDGFLLVEAAALIAPTGQRLLLSGPPNSGKTTLSISLTFGHGWKILSEDVVIIDRKKRQIKGFGTPFNLKPGTRDILASAAIELPGFILQEWFPISANMLATDCDADFAIALHLEGMPPNGSLTCHINTISEHIRKLLPISNLLSLRGTDQFVTHLPDHSCYTLSGGSLAERLNKISELCAIRN